MIKLTLTFNVIARGLYSSALFFGKSYFSEIVRVSGLYKKLLLKIITFKSW